MTKKVVNSTFFVRHGNAFKGLGLFRKQQFLKLSEINMRDFDAILSWWSGAFGI
jgi:hypothetical protein